MKILSKISTLACTCLLAGCANDGGSLSNLGTQAALAALNPNTTVQGALTNAITQHMAASVAGGQIGSQLQTVDQQYRLQQLGTALQSGNITQNQQWVNPQTGSAIALNPTGQSVVNAQTQQQCQVLQEVVTLPNGQTLTENRHACLNPQTNQWTLGQ
ncbi:hypothetical protein KEF85_05715 [Methylomonas paludis]|uniref:Surface antigen domain-containing protein n=1 Tax=Methylomonas paludis TaxID=1173101 RepID=A0A975MQJ3_9GAMM|nr:hypothetical protein [Methylomonas paludis]QWF71955.1 hypothetical protein KEF85_05715 [Methylomonas paludis]